MPKLSLYPHVRDYNAQELHNETGEFFENKQTMAAFPGLFHSRQHMKDAITQAPLTTLTRKQLLTMQNTDVGDVLSHATPRGHAQAKAKEYGRDYGRLVQGFNAKTPLPAPIVVQHDKGLHLVAGNTRLMALAGEGYTMPVRLIDGRKTSRAAMKDLSKAVRFFENVLEKAKKEFWDKEDDDPRETKISPAIKRAALKKFGKWSAVAAAWAVKAEKKHRAHAMKKAQESNRIGFDPNEPDHEGAMARSQLRRAHEYAAKLHNMLKDDSELPGWVQYKIALASDAIAAAYHYLDYQTHKDEVLDG